MRVVAVPPLVIGSGVSGLTTALALGRCVVVTKTPGLLGGSSAWAQGGIAAAVGEGDSPAQHAADTLRVSGGIADPEAVAMLAAAAPERIAWLSELGTRFDLAEAGRPSLGREAGHSHRRILHADGDATGAELMRSLVAAVRAEPGIEVMTGMELIDLAREDGAVAGALFRQGDGDLVLLAAPAVVVATGGIGQIYARTTNPPEVAGDGIAAAARAGARVADMEFVQFHPTALDVPGRTLPLLTEALRGEGAILVTGEGDRFMPAVHRDAELAPRDIVARAIWEQRLAGRHVFLDARDAVGNAFPERFPTVFASARRAGIDPRRELLPVTPAVHYFMGGVDVDLAGRSSLPGLWAVGEAASTGVHGANRLASNSLMEGLVFGARVAESILGERAATGDPARLEVPAAPPPAAGEDLSALRGAMWRHAGIVRTGAGLARLDDELSAAATPSVTGRNLVVLGRLIAAAALLRRESRGGHYRADYPEIDPAAAARRSLSLDPVPAAPLVVAA